MDKQNVSSVLCSANFFPILHCFRHTGSLLSSWIILPLEPEVASTLPDFTLFTNPHFINPRQLRIIIQINKPYKFFFFQAKKRSQVGCITLASNEEWQHNLRITWKVCFVVFSPLFCQCCYEFLSLLIQGHTVYEPYKQFPLHEPVINLWGCSKDSPWRIWICRLLLPFNPVREYSKQWHKQDYVVTGPMPGCVSSTQMCSAPLSCSAVWSPPDCSSFSSFLVCCKRVWEKTLILEKLQIKKKRKKKREAVCHPDF